MGLTQCLLKLYAKKVWLLKKAFSEKGVTEGGSDELAAMMLIKNIWSLRSL